MDEISNYSRTVENLAKTFALKSQNVILLDLYITSARKSGYEQLAEIFTREQNFDREHAKIFYAYLDNFLKVRDSSSNSFNLDVNLEITAGLDGILENLQNMLKIRQNAARFFQDSALDAETEGFNEISRAFNNLSTVEVNQFSLLNELFTEINDNTLFTNAEPIAWRCNKCGYVHTGIQAPDICPLCKQAKANFLAVSREQ